MADSVTKSERSRIMAAVKSSGNKSTEVRFIAVLKAERITGWRRKYKLIGKPDFVFPREKIAVFIDGCFWHGCPKHCRMPADNKTYWENKIGRNVVRDKKTTKALREKGWKVVRVWEHAIDSSATTRRLLKLLTAPMR